MFILSSLFFQLNMQSEVLTQRGTSTAIPAGKEGRTTDGRSVMVRQDIQVTVRRTEDEKYICVGPHGLLVEVIGETPEDAMNQYVLIAADQIAANVEADRSGLMLVGYARQVHDGLIGVLHIVDL